MKYTPGPWVVKSDEWGISVQCKDSVSGLRFAVTPICRIEQEKDSGGEDDARLIAAAPEMYEALKKAADSWEYMEPDVEEAVKSAIAKAEGR